MSEFTPITTQEEFESKLKERLAQKERSVVSQYEGYMSPEKIDEMKEEFERKINEAKDNASKAFEGFISPEDFEARKKDYEAKIAKYETDSVKTRIASEMGLPIQFVSRLNGTTEEEIREDAKIFADFVKEPPLAGTEGVLTDDAVKDVALKKMVSKL